MQKLYHKCVVRGFPDDISLARSSRGHFEVSVMAKGFYLQPFQKDRRKMTDSRCNGCDVSNARGNIAVVVVDTDKCEKGDLLLY
jgi:hypothetical protein